MAIERMLSGRPALARRDDDLADLLGELQGAHGADAQGRRCGRSRKLSRPPATTAAMSMTASVSAVESVPAPMHFVVLREGRPRSGGSGRLAGRRPWRRWRSRRCRCRRGVGEPGGVADVLLERHAQLAGVGVDDLDALAEGAEADAVRLEDDVVLRGRARRATKLGGAEAIASSTTCGGILTILRVAVDVAAGRLEVVHAPRRRRRAPPCARGPAACSGGCPRAPRA